MRGLKGPALARNALLVATACAWALQAPAQADDASVVHALRRGDTVWGVSRRHGVDARALEALNHLADVRTLPVGLRLVLPARSDRAENPSAPARQALAEALWTLRRARFEEALQAAERGRRACEDLEPPLQRSGLTAQLDLVSASAEIAFGRRDAALAHLVSALRLDPTLQLDASTISPKVLSLLEEARQVPPERGEGSP